MALGASNIQPPTIPLQFLTNSTDQRSDPSPCPDNQSSPSTLSPAPQPYMDSNVHDDVPTSQSPPSETTPPVSDGDNTLTGGSPLIPDVDPQILEALKSKDRIYVLKLGETFEALIMERRQRVELAPATSYQRLLVHRCSAYYRLTPESDPVTKGIFVLATTESRIPDRRISELVPAESTEQPAFKIMRRSGAPDRRSKAHSHAGSVAGDDQDLSDIEQSESGSMGGRSHANSGNKKRMTIEEREAAYNEARSRIFMGFEEKAKEKDISASSSTLSLNGSASTSGGGRSSAGDTDDAASSPATESEWSVPSGSNSRDKKDGRRGGPGSTSASSTRSLRNGGSFHGNGSGGSSRNSRAPSPSFSYASLHDSPMSQIYDPSQPHGPNPPYYANQYAYPYSPPGPGPTPPFIPQYQYYQQQHYNPYQPPPSMPPHNSDPNTPSGGEPYSPPHQMNYGPHYGWPAHPQQPPLQSPPHSLQLPLPQQPQQNGHHVGIPPAIPSHSPQYQPFVHPHAYTYPPMNGYYQPPPPAPGQPGPPPAHMNIQSPPQQQQQIVQPPHQQAHQHHNQQQQIQHQQQPSYDMQRGSLNGSPLGPAHNGHYSNNSSGPRNGLGNGVIPPNNNARTASRNGTLPGGLMNGNGQKNSRPQAPSPARGAWSYGPGVGIGGNTAPVIPGGGDSIGPRFNNTNRRPSGTSNSGNNSRASSNDDVSSTSSSTTSSSSRRTFTSTTSSQHPLPARPDWAVGLKAQPTLAGGRHHDLSLGNSRNMSPISPPRSNGHNSPMPNEGSPRQPTSSVSLQATDFPPLTSGGTAQEKRTPVVAGAWGNSRPVLAAASGSSSPLVRHEEMSPKVGDMTNPKIAKRPAGVNNQVQQRLPGEKGKDAVAAKGETSSSPVIIAEQLSSLSLGEAIGADVLANHDTKASAAAASTAPLSQEKESAVVASPQM